MSFIKEFFGQLSGKEAKEQAKKTHAQNTEEINTGESQAHGNLALGRNALTSGRDAALGGLSASQAEALGYYDAMNPAGNAEAQKLYMDAIGANGVEAQQAAAQKFYASDPFRQFNQDQITNALTAKYAATGDSGNARLAVARANLETGSKDWNDLQNRWRDAGAQGYQVAEKKAGVATGYGKDVAATNLDWAKNTNTSFGADAELDWAKAQQQAGENTNLGNTLAQPTMANNFFKFLQIGANAAATAASGGKKS
jgi:hypothetical protein